MEHIKNTKNIGIFIDGDSVSPRNIEQILDEIRLRGQIIIQKIYGDWSLEAKKNILEKSKYNGLETIQADMISGKNSTDLKMAVDIMEILYNCNNIDSFYLVINDADYRHLIPKIKQRGKYVYCIGPRHTNKSLTNICNNFTKITNIEKPKKHKKTKKINLTNSLKLKYINSIIKFIESSSKPVTLSSIKDLLERMYNFDLRDTQFSRFKPFITTIFKDTLQISDDRSSIVTVIDK